MLSLSHSPLLSLVFLSPSSLSLSAMSSSMGTVMSGSLREASRRARALYRRTMRAVPSIVTGYELECTPAQLRAAVRARFAQHSALQDPAVIDVLVFKVCPEKYKKR